MLVLAALLIGLSLGIFSSGGSILTVPVLVYLVEQEPKIAIASSLLVVGSISFIASLFNIGKSIISWPHVLLFGVPSMIGVMCGAYIANFVSGVIQLFVFGLVMLLAVKTMWQSKATPEGQVLRRGNTLVMLDGIVVGAISGVVGVGGGFLIVPALVFLAGLSFIQAAATSLIIISLNSLVGFVKYLSVLETHSLVLDWNVLAILISSGIAGSLIGQKLAGKLPQKHLRKGFAVFLLLMAIFIIYTTSHELLSNN